MNEKESVCVNEELIKSTMWRLERLLLEYKWLNFTPSSFLSSEEHTEKRQRRRNDLQVHTQPHIVHCDKMMRLFLFSYIFLLPEKRYRQITAEIQKRTLLH
jgi:hypothetical protein